MSLTRQQIAHAVETALAKTFSPEAFSANFTNIVNTLSEDIVNTVCEQLGVPAETAPEASNEAEQGADPDATEPTPTPEVPKVLEAAAEADPEGRPLLGVERGDL